MFSQPRDFVFMQAWSRTFNFASYAENAPKPTKIPKKPGFPIHQNKYKKKKNRRRLLCGAPEVLKCGFELFLGLLHPALALRALNCDFRDEVR